MKLSFLHPAKAAMLLFFLSGVLSSCEFSHSRNSTMSSDIVSSFGNGYRKIVKSTNKNEKTLEANQKIQLKSGVISNYKEGLVIKVKEEREGIVCDAELIEEEGVLKLHVKEDALIKAFYDNETEWLEDFLHSIVSEKKESGTVLDMTFSERDEGESLLESVNAFGDTVSSSEIKIILKGLESISMSSSRVKILEALLDKELDQVGQVAVAESIFNRVSMSSQRTSLILKLIEGQELSEECKEYIVNNIDMISMSSAREEVLMALVEN